jgi:hypothetical protein
LSHPCNDQGIFVVDIFFDGMVEKSFFHFIANSHKFVKNNLQICAYL